MAPQPAASAAAPASSARSRAKAPRAQGPSFDTFFLPRKATRKLRELAAPHVESFDYFLERGFQQGLAGVPKYRMDLGEGGARVAFWVEMGSVGMPTRGDGPQGQSRNVYPRDCRERHIMYTAPMQANFCYQVNDGDVEYTPMSLGELPIMVRSTRCHLRDMTPAQLVQRQEEATEMGGYFIVNGLERCIRLLQVPRRNFPAAIVRPSFKNRGPEYTEKGILMRCVRPQDQSSASIALHYLSSGAVALRITVRRSEYLLPAGLVLRALTGMSDRETYRRITVGQEENTFLAVRAEALLRETATLRLASRKDALIYIGSRFRHVLPDLSSSSQTSAETVGRAIIDRYVCVHLADHMQKAGALFVCLGKLYAFVEGRCVADNADAMSFLELLLPGHFISAFVKEKIDEALQGIRAALLKEVRADKGAGQIAVANVLRKRWMARTAERSLGSVGRKVSYLLSTGNVISTTGLDLMQTSGYTIVAERLNFLRYLSHFRSVHRGQFFTTMKTTTVRKLLPESWGFLCPVHTPDGTPCGLLNHLSATAVALAWPTTDTDAPPLPLPGDRHLDPQDRKGQRAPLEEICARFGMIPGGSPGSGDGARALPVGNGYFPVVLDGRFLGVANLQAGKRIAGNLRRMKVARPPEVDPTLEVAFFPPRESGLGPWPGIFLATDPGRVVRPVMQRGTGNIELIGPMEQIYLEIACLPEEVHAATTHQELDPTNMLSLIASLTPFSDQNQSPRNMYQCQMGKQTMGTPAHSMPHRADNKMYMIRTPQAPIVQTRRHAEYQLDEYPQGTNAVVAVISYTGFDMEDAMILNKSSYERGFGHASVYKTKIVDLDDEEKRGAARRDGARPSLRFGNVRSTATSGGLEDANELSEKVYEDLERDGLPAVGKWVVEGDPLYCVVDDTSGETQAGKHKETERACVQSVRILGDHQGAKAVQGLRRVSMTLRFPRNPIIGDKFSSRHGQKGVMSILWPQEDMPFSESGMTPDIIINPHAFPSRMTIGMLVESMAGKSGALHGMYQDATPFRFYEKHTSVNYFGEQLRAAGYSYYGSEPMYSGLSGLELQVDIFIGLVYYQRLRHMVSDKSQVRAEGAVNPLTRQPVKGRKRGGGIRFGEMERDALLSHGTSFLLHDRLMNCSDRHVGHICTKCGSLLSPCAGRSSVATAGQDEMKAARAAARGRWTCRTCGPSARVEPVAIPYVFRYLANELAALGVKLDLTVG